MTEATTPPVEESGEENGGIFDSLRRVLLASIGVAVLTKSELEQFINVLVERGEIAEQEGKKLVAELMERRRKRMGQAEDQALNQMREMLDRMDVPTKADIAALSNKISTLSKKIDELKKSEG